MTNNRQISIIFCGGCNPRIDRGGLAARLKDTLAASGYQVRYNSLAADFVIYISGCTAGCALKYHSSGLPAVSVAAETADAVVIAEEQLAAHVIKKVRGYFE